jgi:hypothetical protein
VDAVVQFLLVDEGDGRRVVRFEGRQNRLGRPAGAFEVCGALGFRQVVEGERDRLRSRRLRGDVPRRRDDGTFQSLN